MGSSLTGPKAFILEKVIVLQEAYRTGMLGLVEQALCITFQVKKKTMMRII